MIRLLIESVVAGLAILALVGVALRRQARRFPVPAWVVHVEPVRWADVAPRSPYVWQRDRQPADPPAEIEAPSWWAIGALSDVRRRAADREGLAEFGVSVPLADAYIWEALNTELAAREVELAPVGWAPPTGHAVTLPADALVYDRYYTGPRCGESVPQAVTA